MYPIYSPHWASIQSSIQPSIIPNSNICKHINDYQLLNLPEEGGDIIQ
jgi:hypothetical protein